MKLKYLLPVATIASVATIITPLVTSCGENEKEWDASWVKDTEYTPMTPKDTQEISGESGAIRLTKLTQLYHDDIKAKSAIYSDDYVNYLSGEAIAHPQQFDIRELKHKTTKVGDLENIPTTCNYKGKSFFRLSVKMEVDATIHEMGQTFEYTKRTATLSNIPVVVEFGDADEEADGANIVYGFADYIGMDPTTDNQWSIDMPEIVNSGTQQAPSLGIGEENVTYNKSNIPTDDDIFIKTAFDTMTDYLISVVDSNYYKNVVEKL